MQIKTEGCYFISSAVINGGMKNGKTIMHMTVQP
jgi:hypothetical protein